MFSETLFDDPGEVEGGGLFGDLLKTGINIGKGYLPGSKAPSAPTPAPTMQPATVSASQPGWVKWAIIGGIGLVVAVVLSFAFKGGGKS